MDNAVSSPDSRSTFTGTTLSGPDARDKSSAPVFPALPKAPAHNRPVPVTSLTKRAIAPSWNHNPRALPENWQRQFVSGILNGKILAISGLLQRGADVNGDLSEQIATLDQQPVNIHGTSPYVIARLGRTIKMGAQCTPLWLAVGAGKLEVVKLLLAKGALSDAKGSLYGPLVMAAVSGHLEIVKVLLEYNADIQAGSTTGFISPLYWAIHAGHQDVVEFLKKNGARLQVGCPGVDALIYQSARMGSTNLIEYLLNLGEHIDNHSTGQRTPVYVAAINGHFEQVKLLLERGANNSHGETGSKTLIWAACRSGSLPMVKYLLDQGADINAGCGNTYSQTNPHPLEAAAHSGNVQLLRFLLRHLNLNLDTPHLSATLFRQAAEGGKVVMMNYIANSAIINVNGAGYDSPISAAARSGSIAAVTWLLDRGADIEANCSGQQTPLCQACAGGHFELVKLLLEKGADINANVMLDTPIVEAASKGHLELVKLLVHKSAAIDADSLLFVAALGGRCHVLEYLFEEHTILQLIKPSHVSSALIHASSQGHLKAVKYLLGAFETHFSTAPGPDISELLWKACQGGHIDVVKYLVELGADVNVESRNFGSAIWTASDYGHLDTVMYLHQQGADIRYSNPANNTDVLSIAEKMGHLDVVQYLQQFKVTSSFSRKPWGVIDKSK
ncbi:ankyrin repeat domain-containing protein [Endozoicomonas acroporae]|uniref:ankyrin repeat domain-containing protein n=1 Tax=Endozoicomonas acroporae TaxID=1701104 RepID=UPI003D7B795F